MKVVRAQREHFTDLWQLTRELHAETVAQYPCSDDGMDADGTMMAFHRVLGWCLDSAMFVFMAYDGDKPAGYMQLQMVPFVGAERAPIMSSFGFYIRPEYRRSQASMLLAREMARVGAAYNRPHVQACVLTANTDARKLYEAHGFTPVAIIYQRDTREGASHGRYSRCKEGNQGGGQGGNDSRHLQAELPGKP